MQSVQKLNKVYVIGVGMTKFYKPRDSPEYPFLGKQAASRALRDAGLSYKDIQSAAVGYCFGDSTCGQRVLYQVGMTGIPIINLNNNCATGSSALYLAHQQVSSGTYDCVMALGFEQMEAGSLPIAFPTRPYPVAPHYKAMSQTHQVTNAPGAPQLFGNAGRQHMKAYPNTKPYHFAKIAHKNHLHSVNNPYSQFRDQFSLEQIEKSAMIHSPLTKLQCCPTSSGGACAIVCSEKFLKKYLNSGRSSSINQQPIQIAGISLKTDSWDTFKSKEAKQIVGYNMGKDTAKEAYKMAGIGPSMIKVIQLHDCFSANELITYEALGLCKEGGAHELIDNKDNTYGGRWVVNPSGGLISKGHPLGATGLAQCAEICWQLRGMAQKRQVKGDFEYGLSHNLGLGGACVVTVYKKIEGMGKLRGDQSSDPAVLEEIEAKEKISFQPKL